MRSYFKIVALLGVVAVLLGAFAAHGLKPLLNASQIETFKTGSIYHFIHLSAMLAIAVAYRNTVESNRKLLNQSFWLFLAGIIFFSGSLYILSTRHLIGGDDWKIVGPITPIGGLFFIAGWGNLFRIS
jgi:uncharacterized membrane protein YgdD (TMEM256/DUF423 family)